MTDKAIVTKEQAELISHLQSTGSNDGIIQSHAKYTWTTGKYDPLNDLTTEELAKALINGYEVEKSPEEELREYFEIIDSYATHDYRDGVLFGIRKTLRTLGIKIEGINA